MSFHYIIIATLKPIFTMTNRVKFIAFMAIATTLIILKILSHLNQIKAIFIPSKAT